MPAIVRFKYHGQRLVFIGGPYPERLGGSFGVKLAPEINKPFDLEMGVKDFGTWTQDTFEAGLVRIIKEAQAGQVPYIGCFAGRGRTGTVIAGLARVFLTEDTDPIKWTRENYNAHAVETPEQALLVATFDVGRVRAHTIPVLAPEFPVVKRNGSLIERVLGMFGVRV